MPQQDSLPPDFFDKYDKAEKKPAKATDDGSLPPDFFDKLSPELKAKSSPDWSPTKDPLLKRIVDPWNPIPLANELNKPNAMDMEPENPIGKMAMRAATMGTSQLPGLASNIWDLAKGAVGKSGEHLSFAKEEAQKGNHASAMAHTMLATPIVGEQIYQGLNKIHDGDVAGGLSTLSTLFGPTLVKGAGKAAGAIAESEPAAAAMGTAKGVGRAVADASALDLWQAAKSPWKTAAKLYNPVVSGAREAVYAKRTPDALRRYSEARPGPITNTKAMGEALEKFGKFGQPEPPSPFAKYADMAPEDAVVPDPAELGNALSKFADHGKPGPQDKLINRIKALGQPASKESIDSMLNPESTAPAPKIAENLDPKVIAANNVNMKIAQFLRKERGMTSDTWDQLMKQNPEAAEAAANGLKVVGTSRSDWHNYGGKSVNPGSILKALQKFEGGLQ